MLLASVGYTRPGTLDQALHVLGDTPGARPLAGGQALLNALKHREEHVALLVDVSRLQELRGIEVSTTGAAELGAGVTYDELAGSAALRRTHPVVSDVAGSIADLQIRCQGTIGGNVCSADPGSHFLPLLVALDATMRVTGPRGSRDASAEEFFLDAGQVALGAGELLRSVSVPPLGGADRVGFSSVQLGKEGAAIARAAALVRAREEIEAARVVLGCAGSRPRRARAMERRLEARPATMATVSAAASVAADGIDPKPSAHASRDYRHHLARVVAKRAVAGALPEGG